MGRPKKERPSKESLLQFSTKTDAAAHYGVSIRTIVRWLQFYDSYQPTKNFGANKLDLTKATEIRHLHSAGWTMKSLAKRYNVTFSTISRIIHNITHKTTTHETSTVSVVYNPNCSVVWELRGDDPLVG